MAGADVSQHSLFCTIKARGRQGKIHKKQNINTLIDINNRIIYILSVGICVRAPHGF